ncbi:MAG: signal peptide peptidase SppA [Aerococcus sp.]|nr:signal peptide peptidase SppA [Aerococcus sp.]
MMKQKRWILIIIGLLILIGGGVTAVNRESRRAEQKEDALARIKMFKNEVDDNIIRTGDTSKKIVVLPIEGTIQSSSSASGLFTSTSGYDQAALLRTIDKIKDDNTVKGVILDVDSPGGETYASVEMYQALKNLKEEKQIPIYVNMKSTAASGAYMISMAADKVYAHSETLTGSIGVIMESMNYKKFLDDHGIKYDVYKSGKQKDMGAPFKDASDEDKKIFQSLIDESYNRFVDIVADGRHMKADDVKKLADGRVYSAKQAKENGLIDEIGDQDAVIDAMMKDHELEGAQVEETSLDEYNWQSCVDFFTQMPLVKRLMGTDNTLTSDAQTAQSLLDKSCHPEFWSIYGGAQ